MASDSTSGNSSSGRNRLGLTGATAVAALLILALLFEGFCQAFAHLVVFPNLDAQRTNSRHYYRASENTVLGYELDPGIVVENEGRRLRVNRFGIREDSDEMFEGKRRIAILGDSVVFGIKHSQEKTIPARVQRILDPDGERIKVLNFAVGGYSLSQLLIQLREKNRIYDVDDVAYLLNFNDFAQNHTIYEGADAGNYRTYVRPTFISPFFIRKAIYRWNKGGKFGSEGWYRWFFEGNEERGQTVLSEMARIGKEDGFRFGVILLPSGISYSESGYGLRDIHERLGAFLSQQGIPVLDPIDVFGADLDTYYHPSDHFYEAGNERMAELIAEFLSSEAFDPN